MNFNLILLGNDSDYIHEFADSIFSISKFNNLISLPNIRKDTNNRFYSKEYLSRALFYEDIEGKIEHNNIIIPGNSSNNTIKEIASYTRTASKVNNRCFIVGILSSSYLNYCERFAKMKMTNHRTKVPDTMIGNTLLGEKEFISRQESIEENHYNNFFKCSSFIYRTDEDVVTNTLLFTNFCIDKQFKIILKEE